MAMTEWGIKPQGNSSPPSATSVSTQSSKRMFRINDSGIYFLFHDIVSAMSLHSFNTARLTNEDTSVYPAADISPIIE